jgi:uncharacterized phiE125 gp8 family phage protein
MLIRMSQPTGLVLSVEDVKEQTEVEIGDLTREALLERYIRAATELIESRTSRFLLPISLELKLQGWTDPLCIPAAPIRSITELVYLDELHVEQTVDAADYVFQRTHYGGALHFDENYTLPTLSSRPDRVTVRFMAGYDDPWASGAGADPETAPQAIDGQMVAIMAATWFMNREATITEIIRRVPFGFEDLIADRRIYR